MKTFRKRLLSLLLCLALLAAWIPMSAQAASGEDTRIADPSTMDSWKDIFLNTGSTENAGAVWTDKSVFTDASAFPGITQNEDDSFLVALSAMGSNMTVTGTSNMPTDTVIILDLSSSMYNGYSRNPATVQTMLTAVNQSIDRLQNMNPNNRVGVTVYFGGQDRNQSTKNNSMVLLPLDRYTGSSTYLTATVTGGRLISVQVNSGLKNAAGQNVPQTKRTVTDVAGTYAQLGILDAMDLFLDADTTVPATASYQPGADRVPVFIFMSDGEPTAATHQYTEKADAGMGNNTVHIRNPDETDFVTQLTAAYAKEMVDVHYAKTTPLFYSLSLGTSVSLAVMDPKDNTTTKTDGYWNSLLANGQTDISVLNSKDGWSNPTVSKTYTVTTATVDSKTFPADKSVRNYTDRHFTASTASQLTDAFADIIAQINLVSEYHPTLTDGNSQLSGYVSFVDKVGKYMTVTDIKGILIDDQLYSGGELSKNFVPGGGELGTFDNPTHLGDEMVHAVQARLGIDSIENARTLIGLAYEYGQLHYNSPDDYSNYIGWYANAAGKYLGFWHEGMDTLPEPTGDPATDPAFIVKSYGYLGAVDESHGVEASDMMYATVQVRRDIATGEESVAFAVPAALIPLLTYEVDLDLDGKVTGFRITGADNPIRLVYEVALEEGIDEHTLIEKVSPEYLAANTDANGAISFYTNQYEADLSVGYGKVNTYSYFNPSRENARYYYLADSPVYTDREGTPYTGSAQPAGTFYRAYTVYTATEVQTHYRRLSDAALETAKQRPDGSWYIPAGNVHVNLDGYTVTKTENATDTMPDAYIPFVDAHNHSVGDLGYNFIIGATLGNNGKLKLIPIPSTGDLTISKKIVHPLGSDYPLPNRDFTMEVTLTGLGIATFQAEHTGGDVTSVTTDENGRFTVQLAHNEQIRIIDLPAGITATVREVNPGNGFTAAYSDDGIVTITKDANVSVTVTNTYAPDPVRANLLVQGTKTLTTDAADWHGAEFTFYLQKHDGSAWQTIATATANEAEPTFDFNATMANEVFTAVGTYAYRVLEEHGGETLNGITYDATIHTFDIVVTDGDMDGKLEISKVNSAKDGTVDVSFTNAYTTTEATATITGTKTLTGRDLVNGEFTFVLTDESGAEVERVSNFADGSFAFSAITYNEAKVYRYQVSELADRTTDSGITFDTRVYNVTVTVTDNQQGALEAAVEVDGGEIIFENSYSAKPTTAIISGQKYVSGMALNPGDFEFMLYASDSHWTMGEKLETVSNDAEGRFTFDQITYETAGTRYYLVKEAHGGATIDGVYYDPSVYHVEIVVIDDLEGQLEAVIHVYNEQDEELNGIAFRNTYAVTGEAQAILSGTKVLEGRELVDGEFIFSLFGANERYEIGDTPLATATNADGAFSFTLDYTAEQVGSTFYYLVREEAGDAEGITYDDTVYHIQVDVIDDGKGGVEAVVTTDAQGDVLRFVNTYTSQTPPPPQTGDHSMVAWFAVLILSCGGVLTLLTLRKKEPF